MTIPIESPTALTLRFGIPSLDRLISGEAKGKGGFPVEPDRSTSLCLLGPDGTGKSVLGLHLASHYCHDCLCRRSFPTILYVSTDLSHSIANNRTWIPFGLDCPGDRVAPFEESCSADSDPPTGRSIALAKLMPLGETRAPLVKDSDDSLSAFLDRRPPDGDDVKAAVGFVDLAANTAGDDWGFINRVLAVMSEPLDNRPLHLMIIDAVEGFETLVGDLDAYGQVSSRRARIAQIMRSAYNKCHIAFIVEEPREGRLPEEFVTDVVIRLRNVTAEDYVRRTVEIEKARGQEHVRGQHPYVIRKGRGSTTGTQPNVDDPMVRSIRTRRRDPEHSANSQPLHEYQGYFHVFSSLHRYSRCVMQTAGSTRPATPDGEYAAFGIRYLDNMLAGSVQQGLELTAQGLDNMGLPCGTVTALVGDSLTQKSRLGVAFLSRCFAPYSNKLWQLTGRPRKNVDEAKLRRALSQIAEEDSRNSPKGFAILLTTNDVDAKKLAAESARWLLRDPNALMTYPEAFRKPVEEYCERRILCRRLEIHDLSSPILMHIVQQAIYEAQSRLFPNAIEKDANERFAQSHSIRLVIDDFSSLMNAYTGIRHDPLFLPTLLFYLRREGVTTLIIDTHTGHPDAAQIQPLDSELRTRVDQRLYTWRVPFYGENRVAISAIPPLSEAVVRELRTELILKVSKSSSLDSTPDQTAGEETDRAMVVDPVFELYSGLEERRPQPVPLEVHLYEETPAFRAYIDQENHLYQKVFAPSTTQAADRREIIVGVPGEYDSLRDFCYLENEIRLDHTLVFQVDEFWAIRKKNALRLLNSYIYEQTSIEGRPSPGIDPFALFQPTRASRLSGSTEPSEKRERRFHAFPVPFDDEPIRPEDQIDRVPFVWDFGFLVCRKRAWDFASNANASVSDCWNAMRKVDDPPGENRGKRLRTPEWSDFLRACRIVAQTESARTSRVVPALDLSLLASESFSCLVLEMWASEIAIRHAGFPEVEISKRSWGGTPAKGLIDWLDEGTGDQDITGLYRRWKQGDNIQFNGYWLELYKVWLMLGATVDIGQLLNPASSFDFRCRDANPLAVASRHWYKTASSIAGDYSASDPTVATQLPGRFSVRGDWFLATSKNSRSLRLAYRAIDLLSSRRANLSRMQFGMGLPVRDIVPKSSYNRLRTRLFKPGVNGERRNVSYQDLIDIGATESNGLKWFWRSGLEDYDRHARVFQKWLYRMMLLHGQLQLFVGQSWVNGFDLLGILNRIQSDPVARKEFFERPGMLESMDAFIKRVDFLIAELKHASPLAGMS